MKTKVLILSIFTIIIIGCNKQPEHKADADDAGQKFEIADDKISAYLDILDNPNADVAEQRQVLCVDYPKTYERDYMPALQQLAPNDYTKEGLLKDFKMVVDYYSEKLEIVCM